MPAVLNDQIRHLYDRSSRLWETQWGVHMHHGFYQMGQASQSVTRQEAARQAQNRLIDELLRFGQVTQVDKVLDVGCGIGGSSLALAHRFGASVTGLTLSPVQAARAQALAQADGLRTDGDNPRATFLTQDVLAMQFPDNTFDLVWVLESAEHLPDKDALLAQCHRVLRPDGRLLLATWCHRPQTGSGGRLTTRERALLNRISRAYALPGWTEPGQLDAAARRQGFREIEMDDWSTHVAPFWSDVLASALRPEALWGLARSGWTTTKAAWAVLLMRQAYQQELIRYTVLSARR